MKKLLLILSFSSLFFACNDGDIIVTDFNFDIENLRNCGGPGGYVFYNINNSSSAESISLALDTNGLLFLENGVEEYDISANSNDVHYRKYNEDVEGDYFCSTIPPTEPRVNIEYLGESGIAELTTNVFRLDDDGLDEDTVSDLDTDEDGLLNYFDEDDDGDNVLTIIELGSGFLSGEEEEPLDIDNDGIPNYLDTDDDNDGVLTRYEDANGDLDPTNDETIDGAGPDYLNNAVTNVNEINQYRLHSYSFNSNISLVLKNIVLINSDEEIIQETLNMGNQNDVINTTITETPEFN